MDGMLARLALAMQEYMYDFHIVYRKGVLNGNMDVLSQRSYFDETPCAITRTVPQYTIEQLQTAQLSDRVIASLLEACVQSNLILKEVNGEGIHYNVIGSYGLSLQ